jgi:hypothetical protein
VRFEWSEDGLLITMPDSARGGAWTWAWTFKLTGVQ